MGWHISKMPTKYRFGGNHPIKWKEPFSKTKSCPIVEDSESAVVLTFQIPYSQQQGPCQAVEGGGSFGYADLFICFS